MDQSGDITTLGEQYIGSITPNVSPDYQPGVVHGGNGNTTSTSDSYSVSPATMYIAGLAWMTALLAII